MDKTLQSTDAKIKKLVHQDSFNSVGKIGRLEEALKSNKLEPKLGKTVVINTDTDNTVGANSFKDLEKALGRVSKVCKGILFEVPLSKDDPTQHRPNGHSFDVFCPFNTLYVNEVFKFDVFDQFVDFMAEKDVTQIDLEEKTAS